VIARRSAAAVALALLAGGVLPAPSSAATLPPFQSSVQRIDDELAGRCPQC